MTGRILRASCLPCSCCPTSSPRQAAPPEEAVGWWLSRTATAVALRRGHSHPPNSAREVRGQPAGPMPGVEGQPVLPQSPPFPSFLALLSPGYKNPSPYGGLNAEATRTTTYIKNLKETASVQKPKGEVCSRRGKMPPLREPRRLRRHQKEAWASPGSCCPASGDGWLWTRCQQKQKAKTFPTSTGFIQDSVI